MKAPHFYFITNDAARCALVELSCHPGNLPCWIAVLDSLGIFLRLIDVTVAEVTVLRDDEEAQTIC